MIFTHVLRPWSAKFIRGLAVLLFWLGAGSYGHAQQSAEPLISATLQGARFEQLVREIEAQTPYRFFFDPTTADSLTVTVQATRQPLDAVLQQAFRNTPLRYAVDVGRRVFVTSGTAIQTQLPPAFFSLAERDTAVAEEETVDDAPVAVVRGPRALSAAEQKLHPVGSSAGRTTNGKATVAGIVRDLKSGEPVVGAAVFVASPSVGSTTDQFGFYSLTLPLGRHDINVRGVGLKNTRRQIQLRSDGKLNIEVAEDVTSLREVVIEAEKDKNVAGLQMGLEKLDIKTLRQVPTGFGESDVLRVVQTLPGVKSVGEGSTGMNVRGGAADQNLILLNDATVYNPSHLFGFFSAFNPDIIKNVELYKSAIPAKFGGRLSSVLDISTRDGNKKQLAGSGGIGLLTSRLTLEGPIVKDKSSFLIGGRTSYSDWLLRRLPIESFKESSAAFYDLNAHLTHEFDEKNTVYASAYRSRDRFKLASDTLYRYQNQTGSVKWKHIFNNRLFGVLTGAYSNYEYNIRSERNPVTASELAYSINQMNAQADFSYYLSPKVTVDYGASSIFYRVSPGTLRGFGSESLVTTTALEREKGVESALYASARIEASPRLSVSLGLRYSMFNAVGPRRVYEYLPGLSKSETTITDTLQYANGKVMKTYHGPEYRVALKYSLTENSSVKASYNRTRQYIHMLSNTASVSPADIWKLSDVHVRPQVGDQWAVGLYRNFKANTIETSVEAYYKALHDFVDYKSGATLLLNQHIETDIVNAKGKAYGVEVMVRKLSGKINGWVSYTYSRSLLQVDGPTEGDRINNGRWYPSNFDKPHDVTMIGNYRFSRRFSTSLNFTYSTGRPITLPLARYYVGNSMRVFYSDRNAYRVPDYYRADFAMNIEGGHKVKKLAHSSWTLAIYNVTGRRNPYSVYFKAENGRINGYQLSIFGEPIPTITYNFKF